MNVTLEMSIPRTWNIDGVTSNSPAMLFNRPWRHRLGFTVFGGLCSKTGSSRKT